MKGNRFTDRIENPLGKPRKKSEKKNREPLFLLFFRFLFPSFLVLLATATTKFVACSAVACVAANPSVTAIAISIYTYYIYVVYIHTYIW